MNIQSLLLAVIQPPDVQAATNALNQAGWCATQISSTGGFLRSGNTTLLSGMEEKSVAQAVQVLAQHCHARYVFVNATSTPTTYMHTSTLIAPVETIVGGATIFALPVQRYVQLGAKTERCQPEIQERRGGTMQLILAIVAQTLANTILNALMAAGYRATLMSTTGGFLRRGNATLLIGVRRDKVNDVLEHIEDTCAALAPTQTGADESCATIFVLDVEHYEQV